MHHPLRRRHLLFVLLPLLAVVLVLVVPAGPAGAHAEVREADPPVDGTGAVGRDEISITFITMDPEVPPVIDVLDPDGDSIVLADPTIVEEAIRRARSDRQI